MSTVSIENAQACLPDLIGALQAGEAVIITQNNKPVARLIADKAPQAWPCQAGSYRKEEFWVGPDFDAPLKGFHEYME